MTQATVAHTQATGNTDDLKSKLILNVPRALLESFDLLPPEPSAHTAPSLRFYSWWFEDVESSDLSLRVSGDSSVGGGVKRRYMMLEYDVNSKKFSLRR